MSSLNATDKTDKNKGDKSKNSDKYEPLIIDATTLKITIKSTGDLETKEFDLIPFHPNMADLKDLCNNNYITSESGETQNNASNNTIDTSSTLELPPLKFSCEKCHFECSKKGDLNRHLITKKHEYMYSVTMGTEETNIYGNKCVNCLKIYKSRNGLWLHAKKCKKQEPPQITEKLENEIKMLTNLVLEMVKSNADLQKQMLEVCKANNKQIDK